MTVITTRVVVREDGSVSLSEPVPAGEYVAQLKTPAPTVVINGVDLPIFDTIPYPGALDFSRADLYGGEED